MPSEMLGRVACMWKRADTKQTEDTGTCYGNQKGEKSFEKETRKSCMGHLMFKVTFGKGSQET